MGTCRACGGNGWVYKDAVDVGNPKPKKIKVPCKECGGTGKSRDPKDMDIG